MFCMRRLGSKLLVLRSVFVGMVAFLLVELASAVDCFGLAEAKVFALVAGLELVH